MYTRINSLQTQIIKNFTTHPTLMRKAGITDYKAFALDILSVIKDRPISFEVFSDDFDEMHDQALEIARWGSNVYLKIPVTNTKGESACNLTRHLAKKRQTECHCFNDIRSSQRCITRQNRQGLD